MSEFYVMWIDQDGKAQYSNEKNARMVVGKIKILLDHKIAFPTRRGCMIEIGFMSILRKAYSEVKGGKL
jgi:hypothetical protein